MSENESLLIMADDGGRENCYEDGEQIDTVNSNEQNVPDSTWSQENDVSIAINHSVLVLIVLYFILYLKT